MYKALLVLHLVGVFLIVGGAGLATALGIKMSKTGNTRVIAELSALSIVAERYVITPGAVLALVAGSFLVHEAGYAFDQFWIIASYILWATAISVGWGVLGPHSSRLNRHARQLTSDGVEESAELEADAAAPSAAILGGVQNLILLTFICLMVVRPGS